MKEQFSLSLPHIPRHPVERKAFVEMQLATDLPWLTYLPSEEQEIFFLELASEMITARQAHRVMELERFINRWQTTAETYASPDLSLQLAHAHAEGEFPPTDSVGIEDLDRPQS